MWNFKQNLLLALSFVGFFCLSSCNNGGKKERSSPQNQQEETQNNPEQEKENEGNDDHSHDHACPAGQHWDDTTHQCENDGPTQPICAKGQKWDDTTGACVCLRGYTIDLNGNCVSRFIQVHRDVDATTKGVVKRRALRQVIEELTLLDGSKSAESIINGDGIEKGIRETLNRPKLDLTDTLRNRKSRQYVEQFQQKMDSGFFDSMKTHCPDDSAAPDFLACINLATAELNAIENLK